MDTKHRSASRTIQAVGLMSKRFIQCLLARTIEHYRLSRPNPGHSLHSALALQTSWSETIESCQRDIWEGFEEVGEMIGHPLQHSKRHRNGYPKSHCQQALGLSASLFHEGENPELVQPIHLHHPIPVSSYGVLGTLLLFHSLGANNSKQQVPP